jgi:SAM-dependent methyltransferase
MKEVIVSEDDIKYLKLIRANVADFLRHVSNLYAHTTGRLLDIAPQDHEGAIAFFPEMIAIDTFDIDPNSGCTYIGDICGFNPSIAGTEVLEHTLHPFNAVDEIYRMLKPGGLLFVSTPFNFRIHGPLPDCWRFTEHGLRALLLKFVILDLSGLETTDRALMPIQYTVVARKAEDL